VKLSVPLRKNFNWFTEWRYYGYGEAFYLYEGFRTNLVTTGVRYER
jgi:outer membrane phospholipase A